MAEILWGNQLAEEYKSTFKEEINRLKQANKRIPKLVVILVGSDPASAVYVKNKEKACQEIGMLSDVIKLTENTKEIELLSIIERLNNDNNVDGILVQLPLPKHLDSNVVINTIAVSKDVDGLHPLNVGRAQLKQAALLPCTPLGVMALIKSINYDLSGKHAVVVGRSNLVGMPIAMLLQQANATVTICHSYTKDLKQICKQADLLVVAVGKPQLITREYVKANAVVIDVGTSKGIDNKLHGDVDFDDVKDVASFITPMPKGVGPMTITMLLSNTLKAYYMREKHHGI